jgi:hypothetical protein
MGRWTKVGDGALIVSFDLVMCLTTRRRTQQIRWIRGASYEGVARSGEQSPQGQGDGGGRGREAMV